MHKSEEGGSLYINFKGECVQDRICSFGSNTIREGAYCYVLVSSSSQFKNHLLDSTITLSGEALPKYNSNIYLQYGETNMKFINISNSKLYRQSVYIIYGFSSDSNVTFSTFSNNTTTAEYYEIYHYGSSPLNEFKILFCNYFENRCNCFIYSYYNFYINNCSFNKNIIREVYFFTYKQFQVEGCYFDISKPGTLGDVRIIKKVSSMYPENHHLSSGLCLAKQKLEFPDEIKTKTYENKAKEKEKFKVKRNNIFLFKVLFSMPLHTRISLFERVSESGKCTLKF